MDPDRSLLLVVCAASPARHTGELARQLVAAGWRVQTVATANASRLIDSGQVCEVTDNMPLADTGHAFPDVGSATAVVIAPATFHTINSIAAGTNDYLAFNVVHEAIGAHRPIIVVPHVNARLAAHPRYRSSLDLLRGYGLAVLASEGACEGGCPPGKHDRVVLRALAGLNRSPLASVVIRPQTAADITGTAHVHVAAWRAGHRGLVPDETLDAVTVPQQLTAHTQALAEQPHTGVTLVAQQGRRILGHITVRADHDDPAASLVHACYVHPEAWGTGIADQLLQRGIWCCDSDLVRLWVLEANQRAIAFYRRHGFRPDGHHTTLTLPGTTATLPLIRLTLQRGSR